MRHRPLFMLSGIVFLLLSVLNVGQLSPKAVAAPSTTYKYSDDYSTITKTVPNHSGIGDSQDVYTFKNSSKDPKTYDNKSIGLCGDLIEASSFKSTSARETTSCSSDGSPWANITIAAPKSATTGPQTTETDNPQTTSGGDTKHDDNATCETTGDPLTWILCPVFNGAADFSDWLFAQVVQPLLKTTPISTDSKDPGYQIWSSFRVYGDIFLVIALLVVVFGQSIGGGLIDAYTAKKVLPRLLGAAVLINLSIYIVAGLVDITNVIGGGIGEIMTAPLKNSGQFNITLNGVQAGGIVGTTAVGGTIAVFLSGLLFLTGAFGHIAAFIGLFILMPAIFGLLAAFITLVLRKAIILALILISPVAFALYCLPNTEKYFRKWWEFLLQTLMVYPIVIIFFSVADILTVTVMKANGLNGDGPILSQAANASGNVLAAIIAFLLQFLPLVFIPYAFKLAGGALGKVHEVLTSTHKRAQEGIKGDARNPNSLRNRVKGNVSADFARGRAQQYRRLSKHGRVGQRLASMQTFIGDPLAREAELNAEAKQRISNIKDNGDDSIVNAAASWEDKEEFLRNKDGSYQTNARGERIKNLNYGKRFTLDGKEVNPADWRAAQRHFPRQSDRQAVADYRSTKVNSTEEAEQFVENYAKMAKQNGMSLEETKGAFTALAFARQNERGEWKHGEWTEDANGNYVFKPVSKDNLKGAKSYVHEQYHKKGAFDASRAFSSQFQAMGAVKQSHLDNVERVRALGSSATDADKQSANDSREELRKILEIQDAWGRNAGGRDENGDPIVGISGASAATQAAYNDLVSVGMSDPYHQNTMRDLKGEIDQGYTWEHLNNQSR